MSKRIIWQCDRCSKAVERSDMPTDWVDAMVKRRESLDQSQAEVRLWCLECWLTIKISLPVIKDREAANG
jgi:hypothetical protein